MSDLERDQARPSVDEAPDAARDARDARPAPVPPEVGLGDVPRRGTGDDRAGLRWWRELAIIGGFYLVYSAVRNLFGSASVSNTVHALHNAQRVIDLEKALGIFNERAVQSWTLSYRWLVRLGNVYYGSLHFVVPVAALLLLFVRWPHSYRLWRNTLAFTTAFALFGFSLFPLMPPRLLCDCPYGAGKGVDYGFVDTLQAYGGLWSFDSGTMKSISNQYAAMPSLHIAWALWCALVIVPRVRRWWVKGLALLYPVATLLAVVVTGNHYWLDAVGGAVTLGAGYVVARFVTRRTTRSSLPEAGEPHPTASP
jgi:hypothetical protein